ncbi:MAG: ABC transporter permease subunit [Actinomycetales bacterium]|nr:ABC transporter permease subunit [Actinomycetales bacterium]
MGQRLRLIWPPVVVAAVFLALWQGIVVVNDIKPYLLPAPSLIFTSLFDNVSGVFDATVYTATTAFLGLMIGIVIGTLIALLASRFIVVNKLATPLAAGLAAVPIIALTPILNNMFDITSRTPRVLVTIIIVFFPIFVNVTRGLTQIQPAHLELMRSLNASAGKVARLVRIPNALPFFLTGMKVAAPLSVIAALVAEYFGGPQQGLGARIASSAANTAYGRAWAYVTAAIVVGLLFYLAVLLLERLVTPWTGRARSA